MYLIGVDSRLCRCIQIWTFPWVLEEDLPDFFNFTLVTKPVGTAQTTGFDSLPRRLKGARRTLPACLQSCSTITEALTTARDAQQHRLYRLETHRPREALTTARGTIQYSLYRPETL